MEATTKTREEVQAEAREAHRAADTPEVYFTKTYYIRSTQGPIFVCDDRDLVARAVALGLEASVEWRIDHLSANQRRARQRRFFANADLMDPRGAHRWR